MTPHMMSQQGFNFSTVKNPPPRIKVDSRRLFYLHEVAFTVVHAQYDLNIFRGLLLTAVELPLQQGYVKIIPHVSCRGDNR